MKGNSYIIIKCDCCGKDVKRYPSNIKNKKHLFCSKTCKIEYFKTHKEENSLYKGYETTVCAECGKEIEVRKSSIKKQANHFCSRRCVLAYLARRKREKMITCKKVLHKKVCCFCGKEYFTYGNSRKYCSDECKNKSKEKITLTCEQCGIMYQIPLGVYKSRVKRGYKHIFCSVSCKRKYFVREKSPLWITDRDKIKRDRDLTLTSEWRQKVFARDNFTCQLCGDRYAKGHKVVLNAHHIVKYSVNKELRYVVENGITLCKDCHKKITGKEEQYEEQLKEIVKNKLKIA